MKKTGFLFVLITGLILFSGVSVNAEIYKWVDDKGNVHFTDNPPGNKQAEQVEVKVNTYTAVEITPLIERLGKTDKVVIYTTEACGYCKKAIKYFKKNNIAYVSYDVNKSRTGKIDYKLLRGTGVPIIIVGSKRMNGFRVSKFKRLYKEQMAQPSVEARSEI